MIVVDTNVIAALLLETEESQHVENALRRDPEWAAPLLWRSELRNVLASLVRTDRSSLSDALDVMATAEQLMSRHEYAVPGREVLRTAADSGCTAYDCEFVVLAREAGVGLLTFDRQLLGSFPDLATTPAAFVAGD